MTSLENGVYDVAIIGLGPAGATLAGRLASCGRIIALDIKPGDAGDDSGFYKPCGGLLAPDAQKTMARLNLTLPRDVLVSPQIFSVRTIDLGSGKERHYQRFYLNLDRHRFDLWLKSLIPSHVEVHHDAKCLNVRKANGKFEVEYIENGKRITFIANKIIGADGANSVVRRRLFPHVKTRWYLSVQQWFVDCHRAPFYSCIFDPELTDSYAWGVSKDGSYIFGGAFDPRQAKQKLEVLKGKLKDYGFEFGAPLKTEACKVLRPLPFQTFCGEDNAFLIGEAAGFISPSSLSGRHQLCV